MNEIILNERFWCENALNTLDIGGRQPKDALPILARYYMSQGFEREDIEAKLKEFLIRIQPDVNLRFWQEPISGIARSAGKRRLLELDCIPVTKSEYDEIGTVDGVLQQRLLFTLVCLAKYGNAANPKNSGWVNRKTSEIFALANITITSKRQNLMINDLWGADMIAYSKIVDNINMQVKILDESSDDVVVRVSDMRNLGNQFMALSSPSKYIACTSCGVIIKKASNRQKYCSKCAKEIRYGKIEMPKDPLIAA